MKETVDHMKPRRRRGEAWSPYERHQLLTLLVRPHDTGHKFGGQTQSTWPGSLVHCSRFALEQARRQRVGVPEQKRILVERADGLSLDWSPPAERVLREGRPPGRKAPA